MRVLIHCSGGPEIGVGHVVRSLALAEEALASGHQVTFAGEYSGAFLLGRLAAARIDVRQIGRTDFAALARVITEARPEVVHLDTYERVPPLARFGVTGFLLSNVEDARFGRRPADLVVDPNLGSEIESRHLDGPGVLLRGARFAPLRSAVTTRRGEWQLREEATNVLVVMGGADPLNLTPRVIQALEATGLPLHVIAISPIRRADRVPASWLQVDMIPPAEDLPALMTHQDLVVSAAGTSVWELCCLGVPMALVCAVENQRPGYARMVAAGAAAGLGSSLKGEEAAAATTLLRRVLDSPATRQNMARQASRILDGLGAWRILRAWEQLVEDQTVPVENTPDLRLRHVTLDDAETLLLWRNDPATLANSRQRVAVTRDQHVGWLAGSLQREDRLLLIVSDERGDIGTVRWDLLEDGGWEVSITVAPSRRGQSLARPLLRAGEEHLVVLAQPSGFYAIVHETNEVSRRLFVSSGYLPDSPADEDGFLTFRKSAR